MKKMLFLKPVVVAVCLSSMLFCFGCNGNKGSDVTSTDNPENEAALQQDVSQTDSAEPDKTEQSENEEKYVPEFINPLTGQECSQQVSCARPVAIMINNLREAIPQMGIGQAQIIYEALAEGGITRLVAIFNDYDDIPEIGSIRSARDYYIDIADAHDAIYVHAGQSEEAKRVIISRGTNNINGEFMYRSAERRKTMAYEHTLMMKGTSLTQAISAKNYRNTSDKKQPLAFKETDSTPEGQDAQYIEYAFFIGKTNNPYAVSFFNYDEELKEYKRGQYGEEHIDGADGKVLSFKNVILIECPHSNTYDQLKHINVNFTGTGKGKYFTNGKVIDICWERQSRTSSYTLYESDGETPLLLNPGKSYIGIVPIGTDVIVK